MCIRDSASGIPDASIEKWHVYRKGKPLKNPETGEIMAYDCLLYTSDAADERSSVDLGGRRIIKKKNKSVSSRENYHVKTTKNKRSRSNTSSEKENISKE